MSRGSVLMLALWSLCLLSGFAVVLSYGVRQKAALVKRLDGRDKLRFMADAGVKKATADLKVALQSSGSEDGSGQCWSLAMSAERQADAGDGIVRFSLIDEERKININLERMDVIERLLKIAAGLDEMEAQSLAASIVDWRDEDSMLSVPFGSAEDRDYTGKEHPYEAKDGPFETLDELLLVNGMTPELFARLRDHITIYSTGKININTAPKEILLAIGLDEYLAGLIELYRNGEDGLAMTEDDNVIEDRAKIVPALSQFYHLSDANVALLTQIVSRYLVTDASHFTVVSRGTLGKTGLSEEIRCVIAKNGSVRSWRE